MPVALASCRNTRFQRRYVHPAVNVFCEKCLLTNDPVGNSPFVSAIVEVHTCQIADMPNKRGEWIVCPQMPHIPSMPLLTVRL
jgi:hypothetical protein